MAGGNAIGAEPIRAGLLSPAINNRMAALRDPLIGPPGAVLPIAPQPGEATAFLSRETGRSPDESRCPAPVSKDGGIAEQAGQKINRIFLP